MRRFRQRYFTLRRRQECRLWTRCRRCKKTETRDVGTRDVRAGSPRSKTERAYTPAFTEAESGRPVIDRAALQLNYLPDFAGALAGAEGPESSTDRALLERTKRTTRLM